MSKPELTSDQLFDEAQLRLKKLHDSRSDPDNPPINAKEEIDNALQLILRGAAQDDIEQADRDLATGRILQENYIKKIDQALGYINNLEQLPETRSFSEWSPAERQSFYVDLL